MFTVSCTFAPMDSVELRAAFERHDIRRVKVGGFDVDGVLRGKYVSLDKFWSAVEGGFGFCDVIFGWDITDVLYDNGRLTGWHTGYPDTHATVDLDTFRVIPWEPNTACFLVDFVLADGSPHPACPRSLLKRVIARAAKAGHRALFAAEFEFFLFHESASSLHQKGFRDIEPLSPGMFGYSWVREGQNSDLCHAILDEMEAFGIPIEGLHTETGPGVYEVAIRYDDALAMADKGALFKSAMKQLCARRNVAVTFMAKWNADLPGSSGHLHQSLWSMDGRKNLFHDAGRSQQAQRARPTLPRRSGRADAQPHCPLFADRQQLQAVRARRLGATDGELGRGEPHVRHSRHSRRRKGDAARVPTDRCGHQPLHRHRGVSRGRPLGDREQRRAAARVDRRRVGWSRDVTGASAADTA